MLGLRFRSRRDPGPLQASLLCHPLMPKTSPTPRSVPQSARHSSRCRLSSRNVQHTFLLAPSPPLAAMADNMRQGEKFDAGPEPPKPPGLKPPDATETSSTITAADREPLQWTAVAVAVTSKVNTDDSAETDAKDGHTHTTALHHDFGHLHDTPRAAARPTSNSHHKLFTRVHLQLHYTPRPPPRPSFPTHTTWAPLRLRHQH